MGRTFSAVPYTYLKRGVYYFVRRIPSDLRTFYRTDRVILSLCTKSLQRASRASERLSSRLDDYWLDLRLKQKVLVVSNSLPNHQASLFKSNYLPAQAKHQPFSATKLFWSAAQAPQPGSLEAMYKTQFAQFCPSTADTSTYFNAIALSSDSFTLAQYRCDSSR